MRVVIPQDLAQVGCIPADVVSQRGLDSFMAHQPLQLLWQQSLSPTISEGPTKVMSARVLVSLLGLSWRLADDDPCSFSEVGKQSLA